MFTRSQVCSDFWYKASYHISARSVLSCFLLLYQISCSSRATRRPERTGWVHKESSCAGVRGFNLNLTKYPPGENISVIRFNTRSKSLIIFKGAIRKNRPPGVHTPNTYGCHCWLLAALFTQRCRIIATAAVRQFSAIVRSHNARPGLKTNRRVVHAVSPKQAWRSTSWWWQCLCIFKVFPRCPPVNLNLWTVYNHMDAIIMCSDWDPDPPNILESFSL